MQPSSRRYCSAPSAAEITGDKPLSSAHPARNPSFSRRGDTRHTRVSYIRHEQEMAEGETEEAPLGAINCQSHLHREAPASGNTRVTRGPQLAGSIKLTDQVGGGERT